MNHAGQAAGRRFSGGCVIVGSGIDVIEIARIRRALERSGDRFARRVFAGSEIDACLDASGAYARAAPHFAVRFAAKEAVMKALGTGWARGVRWVEIETVPVSSRSAALSIRLHGRVAEIADEIGAALRHLAVSRTRSHAIAMALFEGDPR